MTMWTAVHLAAGFVARALHIAENLHPGGFVAVRDAGVTAGVDGDEARGLRVRSSVVRGCTVHGRTANDPIAAWSEAGI
jgi:hypothetical protein